VLAFCDGGYTANLPLEDLSGGRAWIAYQQSLRAMLRHRAADASTVDA
jgi:hypothetical protein